MRRLLMASAVAALMAAMMVGMAAPAMANDLFDDDDDDGDEIDDVDVEEAFFDGDDVCVLVVTEFEDGSVDVDEECVDVF